MPRGRRAGKPVLHPELLSPDDCTTALRTHLTHLTTTPEAAAP
ncbi:hypothetical protein ABZ934_00795 [Streptomyces sp. NPDC046557]